MRQTASNRRSRSRQGGKRSGGNARSGGNRKDSRGRGGNPSQQVDRYKAMARDALQSGDRILAENYFQHADHFQRLLNDRQGKGANAPAPKQVDGAGAEAAHAARRKANAAGGDVPADKVKPQSKPAAKESPPTSTESSAKSRQAPQTKRESKAEPQKSASHEASDGNGAKPPKSATSGKNTAGENAAKSAEVAEPSLQGVAFLKPTEARPEAKKRRKPSAVAADSPPPKAPAKRGRKAKAIPGDQADEAAG